MCKQVTTKEGVSSNDYALKSCIFSDVDILLITGRQRYHLPPQKSRSKICSFHPVICADGQNLNIPTRTAYLRSMKLSGAPFLAGTYYCLGTGSCQNRGLRMEREQYDH